MNVHSYLAQTTAMPSTSERILDAAVALFASHGFHGTSVRMLSERAGVSQGLLYNYFDGKDGLLRAIFERSAAEVERTLDEATGTSDPDEAVRRLIRSAFEAVSEAPDFWRLTYQLRMQTEAMAPIRASISVWAEAVRHRIEALLVRAGVPMPELRARTLFAGIDGAAQHWVLDPERYPLAEVGDSLAELALAPPTDRARPESAVSRRGRDDDDEDDRRTKR
jgi:AcrR family transcriptional regulator